MAEPSLPTQKFVDIKEIRNGVLYLKSGGLRQVLIVSGVNFDLKSEAEQNLILVGFQNFLNSLDFSIQLFVHSRKVNVDAYLQSIEARREEETNELLQIQIGEYIQFIRAFVEQNTIIAKTFFVVVPYETTPAVEPTKQLLSFLRPSGPKPDAGTNLQEVLDQLTRRVAQIVEGLEVIGLRAALLEDEELTELFYNLYNPQLTEKKTLEIAREKHPRKSSP